MSETLDVLKLEYKDHETELETNTHETLPLRKADDSYEQLHKPEPLLRADSPVPLSTDECKVEPSTSYENQSNHLEEFGHDEDVIESTETDRHDIDNENDIK